MRRFALPILGFCVSLALLAYLFRDALASDQFSQLFAAAKRWDYLVLGWCAAFAAVCLTFARWYLLVRALDLPFSLKDAFRLGFIGFFLNFFTVGVVGGDALKAVFLANQVPRHRTEAVASVVIDRVIGLFALFLLTTAAILFTDVLGADQEGARMQAVRLVCGWAIGLAGLGCAGIVALQFARRSTPLLQRSLFRLPAVGHVIQRLHLAAVTYQHRQRIIYLAIAMSLGVHSLNAIAIYCIATGLPGESLSLADHLVVVPMAMVAGSLPLPGGLGSFEWALDFLYRGLSPAAHPIENGLIVALGYRVATIAIATIGVVFYFVSKREIKTLMQHAAEPDPLPESLARNQTADL